MADKRKKYGKRKRDVQEIFRKLEKSATNRRGKQKQTPRFEQDREYGTIRGKVCASGKGYAFLAVEGQEQDLFLPARMLHGAMHGDLVYAKLIERGTKERGGVAEVTEILERGMKTFVGTVRAAGRFFVIDPDEKRVGREADLSSADLAGARPGDKVVAEFTDYGDERTPPLARVVEVLGDRDATGVDILSVIRSYELYEEFPREVEEQALTFAAEADPADCVGRTDYREDLVITIDGEDAKDLDDAVYVRRDGDGYALNVHIADVAHYVRAGSCIDREAYRRGTSVYFPDRVLPMLPRQLSNGICSLSGGKTRLTLSCEMKFDAAAELRDMRVTKGVICSAHRMTYTAVQAILDGDEATRAEYPDLIEPLGVMKELAEKLTDKRFARGAVDFAVSEPKIVLDPETGKIADVVAAPRYTAHRIIEEFMLAANEAVAEKFERAGVPFVYRVHEVPTKEKIDVLREFIAGFGLTLDQRGEEILPAEIQAMLRQAESRPCAGVVNKVALRAMQKARYLETCKGHFGLAAKYYCHFTSPIRRYPDLCVHRVIGEWLANGAAATEQFREFVVEACVQSSERERVAEEAERAVDDLKKAEYMEDHIGERFDGTISGVTPFGLFVELSNTVEGLLRTELLPDDAYECDEVHYVLKGSRTAYRLGDPISVIVMFASKESRKVEFCLEREDDAEGKPLPEIKKMVMPSDASEDRYRDLYRAKSGASRAPRKKGGRRR